MKGTLRIIFIIAIIAMMGVTVGKAADHGPILIDPITGMQFVLVKGGCYQMGDIFGAGAYDERPVHEVCISDFYIGKYEVTQGQWKKVMRKNPSCFKDCGDDCPVERVSWNDIQIFISKLNSKSGKNYRLPTEAEWEYAARSGGKKEKYSGTDSSLDDYAWYGNHFGSKTHSVGEKKPNGLGIYDMSGNVAEWCSDWYKEEYYSDSPRENPKGPESGVCRVLRGCRWHCDDYGSRVTRREGYYPEDRFNYLGFRVVVQ